MKNRYLAFFGSLLILANLFFIVLFTKDYLFEKNPQSKSSKMFMGIIVKNYDKVLPSFLKTVDRYEYNKNDMVVQLDLYNESSETKKNIENWVKKNKKFYSDLSVRYHKIDTEKGPNSLFDFQSKIKNQYLKKADALHCEYCLLLESDALLAPYTLKHLIRQNKPVISPLLRPIPEQSSAYRNYFKDIDHLGYYKGHSDEWSITDRTITGTYEVPVISRVHLIQGSYLAEVSFSDDKSLSEYDWIKFSRTARKNEVCQYICNTKEFGKVINLPQGANEREFVYFADGIDIDKKKIEDLLADQFQDDPDLKNYVNNFPVQDYQIYQVNNQDLFFVDDKYDYIKSVFIKKGLPWEDHLVSIFKEHIKPGTIVLDIGGHMGTHTLNFSKIVGPEGTVHVFEPQNKMFTELVINMDLNKRKNIVFHHRALGSQDCSVEMCSPHSANEGMAHIKKENQVPLKSLNSVKLEKLDNFNLNNVSFIKMDIEGHEMEAIKGGRETILRNKPVMLVELKGGSSELSEKIAIVEKMGYKSRLISGEDYLFTPL